MTEDREQKAEDRKQKTEDGGPRIDGRFNMKEIESILIFRYSFSEF
jgi:hypothetical protein